MNFEYMTKGMQIFLAFLIVLAMIVFVIAMSQMGRS